MLCASLDAPRGRFIEILSTLVNASPDTCPHTQKPTSYAALKTT
jgi:hypothetical protein